MEDLRAAITVLRNRVPSTGLPAGEAEIGAIWEAIRLLADATQSNSTTVPDPLDGSYDFASFRRGEAPSWARPSSGVPVDLDG